MNILLSSNNCTMAKVIHVMIMVGMRMMIMIDDTYDNEEDDDDNH